MKRLALVLGTSALAAGIALSTMQPAKADGAASTRNIILGATALVAGLAIESNLSQKQRLANTVVGYTATGATVYADNHVVLPNGQSYYPNNVGQTIACSNGSCTITGNSVTAGYANGYNYPYYGP